MKMNKRQREWQKMPGETIEEYAAYLLYLNSGEKTSAEIINLYDYDNQAELREAAIKYHWHERRAIVAVVARMAVTMDLGDVTALGCWREQKNYRPRYGR